MDYSSFHHFSISEDIQKALTGLEYEVPTEVQASVIPLALDKKDLIVKAQTGSGKTAAYAIPVCEFIDWLENKPQALVLTPTRELAVQVQEDFTNIGRFKRIKASAIYGRHAFAIEKTELKQKTHVVTGTPGRVLDHIKKGTLPLTRITCLILDEADRMLDMGFLPQVEAILKELPGDRMTMLFSATMPEEIKNISSNYMRNPVSVDVSEDCITTADIDHAMYEVAEEDKLTLLTGVTIMEQPQSCIIFCETKEQVGLVSEYLKTHGYDCRQLHGGMEQKDRLSAIRGFKRGAFRYLVATDLAARGIDVESVSLVINYDIPLKAETYVHRTGRTGRAGQKGKAVTFVTQTQTRYLQEMEDLIGFPIQRLSKPEEEQVSLRRASFEENRKQTPPIKKIKGDLLSSDIMKLRFSGGKNKKLRATNFVGVISNLEGMKAEDIGIITVQDTLTYVEILNGKGAIVLKAMENTMIGGRKIKVSQALNK